MINKFNVGDIIIKVKDDGGSIPVGTIVKVGPLANFDVVSIESLDGKDIPGLHTNRYSVLEDSYELHNIQATKQTAASVINYPPIGSRWKKVLNNREIIITAHGINFQGHPDKTRVQFKYVHNNKISSRNVKDFSSNKIMIPLAITSPIYIGTAIKKIKKENNDSRTHCYACGALTRVVDTGFSGSTMRVCTKCGK